MKTQFLSRLASRGLVRVAGTDGSKFLQSLVTADVNALRPAESPSTATAFLDRRGRILFGALIHAHHTNEYLIDTPATDVVTLLKHLRMFRLRSAVDIDDVSSDYSVWQCAGHDKASLSTVTASFSVDNLDTRLLTSPDPRLPSILGYRAVADNSSISNTNHASVDDELAYERLRVAHAVPDGYDFRPGGLPLELGLHLTNGVSFNKGCYLGQELTARSHFTGVLRKRLTTIIVLPESANLSADSSQGNLIQHTQATQALALGTEDVQLRVNVGDQIFVDGKAKPAGIVTSAVDNIGLAVLRMTDASDNDKILHLQDGRRIRCVQQTWTESESESEKSSSASSSDSSSSTQKHGRTQL